MGMGNKNPGCNCCGDPATCDFMKDDFNRADNDDVGADWIDTTNQWEIENNKLVYKKDPGDPSDIVILGNNQHPSSPPGTWYGKGEIEADDLADETWVIIDSTNSLSFFNALKIVWGNATTDATVSLYRSGFGDIGAPISVPWIQAGNGPITFEVCLKSSTIKTTITKGSNGLSFSRSTIHYSRPYTGFLIRSIETEVRIDNV